jgi:hypothetical protein
MPRARIDCPLSLMLLVLYAASSLPQNAHGQVVQPAFFDPILWTGAADSSFTNPANWDPMTVPNNPDADPDDDGIAAVMRLGATSGNQATIADGDVVTADYVHVWTDQGNAGVLNMQGGELQVGFEMRVETEVTPDGCCWVPDERDTPAVFNLSGGAVTVGADFHVGRDNVIPAKGIMNMSGGTLDIGGRILSGDAASGEDVESGSAVMNISGGSMIVRSEWSGTSSVGEDVVDRVETSRLAGQFNLSGTGSAEFLNPAATIQVGQGNAGDGRIHIQDSGSLTINGTLLLGQQQVNGNINKAEFVIESGSATLAAVRVGGWAAGGLDPAQGRQLSLFNVSGGTTTAALMAVGGNYNTRGELNLSGGSLAVTGATHVASLSPEGVAGAEGLVNVTGGSFQTGSLSVGVAGEGIMNVSDGTVKVDSGLTIGETPDGQGTFNLTGGVLDMSGSAMVFGDGDAAFNFDGGTVLNASSVDFDLVNNGGTLAPGDPIGTTTVNGSYFVVNADSSLAIQLGGTADGEFDKLIVTADLLVDGSLDVSLMESFLPSAGDSFDILDFATISGAFAQVNLPALGGGLTWDQSNLLTDGSLSIIGGGAVPGDFNNDGVLDAVDIDLLTAVVLAGTNDSTYDVNGDSVVNQADRDVWVESLRGTWVGDANLDGLFDSSDLVVVFGAGKYETGEAAGWGEGDWDGNGLFGSGDLVAAFSDGGYESGPRGATASVVPEPASAITLLPAILLLAAGRRRTRTRSAVRH